MTDQNKLDQILAGQQELKALICDPEQGLIVRFNQLCSRVPDELGLRLDRLEQSESRRNKWTAAAGTTALGAILMALWSLITTGKAHP